MTKNTMQSSKGHHPGSRDENKQQAYKSKVAAVKAGFENRDEDAADPQLAAQDTSKSFDRDQQELELGLDGGDLDTDVEK